MQRTMALIRRRGVKYCPAPFLPSLAAFSSRPSNAAALTSMPSAVHSVSSMTPSSFFRLTGLLNPRLRSCKDVSQQTSLFSQRAKNVDVVVP